MKQYHALINGRYFFAGSGQGPGEAWVLYESVRRRERSRAIGVVSGKFDWRLEATSALADKITAA